MIAVFIYVICDHISPYVLTPAPPSGSSGTTWTSGSQLRTTLHSPIDPVQMTSLKVTLHGQGAAISPPLLPRTLTVTRVDSQLIVTSQDMCTDAETMLDKETIVFRPCGAPEN